MADQKTSYTALEVDQKLADIKKEMIERIDSVVLMNDSPTAPSATDTSMWFKITSTDTK